MYSFKIKESRYIALFVVSGSVKKLSSIDYFPNGKVLGLTYIAYIVIY